MRRLVIHAASCLALISALMLSRPATVHAGRTCNPNLNLVYGTNINTQFDVCLSSEGNVVRFAFYGGDNVVANATWKEGYLLWVNGGTCYWDIGDQSGYPFGSWAAASVLQPNGPGKLPITITRSTTDGHWRLTQTYAKDNVEGDFTTTMALKNTGEYVDGGVFLSRWNAFDLDEDTGGQSAVASADSIEAAGFRGVALQIMSRTIWHNVRLSAGTGWTCSTSGGSQAVVNQDLSGQISYNLGGFATGQTKTVKFMYSRK